MKKKTWIAEALLNKKTNSLQVITYENEVDRALYKLLVRDRPDYEVIKVKITRI